MTQSGTQKMENRHYKRNPNPNSEKGEFVAVMDVAIFDKSFWSFRSLGLLSHFSRDDCISTNKMTLSKQQNDVFLLGLLRVIKNA